MVMIISGTTRIKKISKEEIDMKFILNDVRGKRIELENNFHLILFQ